MPRKKPDTPGSYLRKKFTKLKAMRKRVSPDMAWEITAADMFKLWKNQNGRCDVTDLHMTYFGDRGWTNCSIDRIDNNVGYVLENVRLVCWSVNRMKSTMSQSEFDFWVKSIASSLDRKDMQNDD